MNPSGTINAARPDGPLRPLLERPVSVCDMTADSIPEPRIMRARSPTNPTPSTARTHRVGQRVPDPQSRHVPDPRPEIVDQIAQTTTQG
jgi:hypothetical protein